MYDSAANQRGGMYDSNISPIIFEVDLRLHHGQRLGIDVVPQGPCALLVQIVNESGLVQAWNSRSREPLRVHPGDHIIAINGVEGEISVLTEQLRSGGDVKLMVQRQPLLESSQWGFGAPPGNAAMQPGARLSKGRADPNAFYGPGGPKGFMDGRRPPDAGMMDGYNMGGQGWGDPRFYAAGMAPRPQAGYMQGGMESSRPSRLGGVRPITVGHDDGKGGGDNQSGFSALAGAIVPHRRSLPADEFSGGEVFGSGVPPPPPPLPDSEITSNTPTQPETKFTFEVVLQRSEGTRLGIDVTTYMVNDVCGLVVRRVSKGCAIDSWNQTCQPGHQVRPGDCLIAVNGVTFDFGLMWEELRAGTSELHLIIARPSGDHLQHQNQHPAAAQQKISGRVPAPVVLPASGTMQNMLENTRTPATPGSALSGPISLSTPIIRRNQGNEAATGKGIGKLPGTDDGEIHSWTMPPNWLQGQDSNVAIVEDAEDLLRFEVVLEPSEHTSVGIEVVLVSGSRICCLLVQGIDEGGRVDQWNKAHSFPYVLQIGDHIIQVNGVSAFGSAADMGKEFGTSGEIRFSVSRGGPQLLQQQPVLQHLQKLVERVAVKRRAADEHQPESDGLPGDDRALALDAPPGLGGAPSSPPPPPPMPGSMPGWKSADKARDPPATSLGGRQAAVPPPTVLGGRQATTANDTVPQAAAGGGRQPPGVLKQPPPPPGGLPPPTSLPFGGLAPGPIPPFQQAGPQLGATWNTAKASPPAAAKTSKDRPAAVPKNVPPATSLNTSLSSLGYCPPPGLPPPPPPPSAVQQEGEEANEESRISRSLASEGIDEMKALEAGDGSKVPGAKAREGEDSPAKAGLQLNDEDLTQVLMYLLKERPLLRSKVTQKLSDL